MMVILIIVISFVVAMVKVTLQEKFWKYLLENYISNLFEELSGIRFSVPPFSIVSSLQNNMGTFPGY